VAVGESTVLPKAVCALLYLATSASNSATVIPSPLTVNASGTEVAVGISGVGDAFGMATTPGVETEAHAESPSAKVRNIQMILLL